MVLATVARTQSREWETKKTKAGRGVNPARQGQQLYLGLLLARHNPCEARAFFVMQRAIETGFDDGESANATTGR